MNNQNDKKMELVANKQSTRDEKLLDESEKQTRVSIKEFIRKARKTLESGTESAIVNSIVAACIGIAYSFGAANYRAQVFWGFVRQWNFKDNRTGIKFLNYDLMLYPFYKNYFVNEISAEIWGDVQAIAKANLELYKDDSKADKKCLDHWQSIIDGVIPYGYSITVIEETTSGIETEIKT